ncbi:MAG: HD domain-containing protein [Planctomycetota bacterium]|nr:MAG: HD domain-containing protein [Planctomycetota bacterium]
MEPRTATVLITHESARWRRRARAVLEEHGFPCVETSHWTKWLALSNIPAIDCVLVGMPTGRPEVNELIRTAHRYFPAARVIAVTAEAEDPLLLTAFQAGAWDLLPLSAPDAALVASVRQALDVARAEMGRGPGGKIDTARIADRREFLRYLDALDRSSRLQQIPLALVKLVPSQGTGQGERKTAKAERSVPRSLIEGVRHVFRASDLIAVTGTGRLAVALASASGDEPIALVEELRRAIRTAPAIGDSPPPAGIAAGIAISTPAERLTAKQLWRRARIALEQALRTGPDRTVSWSRLIESKTKRRNPPAPSAAKLRRLEPLWMPLPVSRLESVRALIAAVEAKDPYTRAHSVTVARYAEAIARRMNLPPATVTAIHSAALLHDIGKIGVPDAVLTKAGRLTEAEFRLIKRHPETALEILSHLSTLTEERAIILHHHERWDGTGYPAGLSGKEIPIGARIVAVADALDTMLSARSYKQAYDLRQVREELIRCAGTQFDPVVIRAAVAWIDEEPQAFRPSSSREQTALPQTESDGAGVASEIV